MSIDYAKLARQGFEYVVVAAHDGPYGEQGTLISKHKSYDAAQKAAAIKAPGEYRNWLAIRDTRSYA